MNTLILEPTPSQLSRDKSNSTIHTRCWDAVNSHLLARWLLDLDWFCRHSTVHRAAAWLCSAARRRGYVKIHTSNTTAPSSVHTRSVVGRKNNTEVMTTTVVLCLTHEIREEDTLVTSSGAHSSITCWVGSSFPQDPRQRTRIMVSPFSVSTRTRVSSI